VLFNSYVFVFLFLPITLIGFYWLGAAGHRRVAMAWLVGLSLIFYGWWNPAYLGLLLAAMIVNYGIGVALTEGQYQSETKRKLVLGAGVGANLAMLGYFKYANFFVDNINAAFGSHIFLETIVLPLAISFFTFQKIAFLVDAYRGETKEFNFLNFSLFVMFFPQLIAGPLVHHKEMMPQFMQAVINRVRYDNLVIGFSIFVLGLFKKVVLADSVARYASPVFDAAASGMVVTTCEAWVGVLAYTFQLYFDFSGYSDMAIGISRMFGIKLPLNFHSPYKAANIIDFWRRWHMTLSRFLRDYLYISLGGNKRGRYRNLMITMLLGGFWHGANWTYVIWGALHGSYLIVNHAWQSFRRRGGRQVGLDPWWWVLCARLLTFLAVVIGWVYFRAANVAAANSLLKSMFGFQGFSLPAGVYAKLGAWGQRAMDWGVQFNGMFANDVIKDTASAIGWVALVWIIAWIAPNTQQIMADVEPAFDTYHGDSSDAKARASKHRMNWLRWKPTIPWAMLTAVAMVWALLVMSRVSEFLYFQF
jgi:alginate O-acetyltransferase complex protein AlgI